MNDWTVIIPVKAFASAKSRLAPAVPFAVRIALARAFALDTIDAALAARNAGRVLVVTGEANLDVHLPGHVEVLHEKAGAGLTSAIETAIAAARSEAEIAVAVLLGDLPAIGADGLESALDSAARHPHAFVRDADGRGTTLATARARQPFAPAFGDGSAARHLDAGFIDLVAAEGRAVTPGVRWDVDTIDALTHVLQLGVGRHTAQAVAAARRAGSPHSRNPPPSATERLDRDPHTRVQGIR